MTDYSTPIKCPACGEETKVIDSRGKHGDVVRRRRECKSCGQRFTTREIVESQRDATHEKNRLIILDRRKLTKLIETLADLLGQLKGIEDEDD